MPCCVPKDLDRASGRGLHSEEISTQNCNYSRNRQKEERGLVGALLSLVVQVAAGAPGLGTDICQVSSLILWTCVRAVVVSPEDDQDPRPSFLPIYSYFSGPSHQSSAVPHIPFPVWASSTNSRHSFPTDLTLGPEVCMCKLGTGVLKDTSPLFFLLAAESPDL